MIRRMSTSTLLRAGLIGIAARGIILMALNRAGGVSDAADFGLSLLFGVSASLVLIAAWRRGRAQGESWTW